VRKKRRKSK